MKVDRLERISQGVYRFRVAGAGLRRLEDRPARPERPHDHGHPDLHARRRGDPGRQGDPGHGAASPATFVADHELLQRERKDDIPGWLWTAACLVVLALSLMFMASLAWGVARVARTGNGDGTRAARRPRAYGSGPHGALPQRRTPGRRRSQVNRDKRGKRRGMSSHAGPSSAQSTAPTAMSAAAGLVIVMALGSVVVWLVSPLVWLWIGSQMTDSTQPSLGPYLLVLVGMVLTAVAIGKVLGMVNRTHMRITGRAADTRERREVEPLDARRARAGPRPRRARAGHGDQRQLRARALRASGSSSSPAPRCREADRRIARGRSPGRGR